MNNLKVINLNFFLLILHASMQFEFWELNTNNKNYFKLNCETVWSEFINIIIL